MASYLRTSTTAHVGQPGMPQTPISESRHKTVAILQSNYIPWKGYFDLIHRVDEFIFADDLQYTRGDWRNRNTIKTSAGTHWLTIPCGPRTDRNICDVQLRDHTWQRRHWQALLHTYRRARWFHMYSDFFEALYLDTTWRNLSDLNQYLIKWISRTALGIDTNFLDSRQFDLQLRKGQRVLELLRKVDADAYLSGPAGQAYLDPQTFVDSSIELKWMSYDNYPAYPQLGDKFEHCVSIVDLLFHCGPDSRLYFSTLR